MKKLLFSIMLCVVLLAMLAGPAGATGAVRTPYTGIEDQTYCFVHMDPRCLLGSPGELITLPNGKSFTRDVVWVIGFISADPRFNGVTIVSVNIYASMNNSMVIIGKWHLEPNGYDGYWEGPVTAHVDATGVHSTYTGQGYGDLAGMVVNGTNDNGSLSGVIIDLP
jgi:hypothetical protein